MSGEKSSADLTHNGSYERTVLIWGDQYYLFRLALPRTGWPNRKRGTFICPINLLQKDIAGCSAAIVALRTLTDTLMHMTMVMKPGHF